MKYIDIFAGCGGISLGLHKAGINGIFAIEKSEMAFETLKFNLIENRNHFSWVNWLPKKEFDINYILNNYKTELKSLNGTVDLIVGGPPCQGFSLAGKRDENDLRNSLINSYIEFISLVKPNYLLFENVRGFGVGFKKKNGERGMAYSEHVIQRLEALGYIIDYKIVNFSEFGVPQRRNRFIISGVKNTLVKKNDFFERLEKERGLFLKYNNLNENVSVKEAISDLLEKNGKVDSLVYKRFKEGKYNNRIKNSFIKLMKNNSPILPDSHRFPNHSEKTIEKFNYILNSADKNKTISEDIKNHFNMKKHSVIPLCGKSTSPTLTTLPDDYIHYCEPRILTVREYARIQSFPDDFIFKGKYTSGGKNRRFEVPRYTQIGNAIPPFFGEVAGLTIKKWDKELQKTKSETKVSEKNNDEVLA